MRTVVGLIAVGACLTTVGATTAARSDQTARPGQMTEARVWVENRGREQAVPVDVRAVTFDAPIRVQVVNGDINARAQEAVLVRQARQAWEYKTITVSAGDDAALKKPGEEGWETTGIAWVAPEGTTLLLKRLK